MEKIYLPYTKDDRITELFKFKSDHPETLLCAVDKSNDFVLLNKSEYHLKLKNLFENLKFEKLNNFNLQDELVLYRRMLTNTIEHCLGPSNYYLVQPKKINFERLR